MSIPTCSRLVGRHAHVARLRAHLGIDPSGPARHVLLGGDAGVGKTRLLTALREELTDRGWLVLAGHCLDFGDSALSYLPFTEVVGRAAVVAPDVVTNVAEVFPALHRLSPGRRLERTRHDLEPADLSLDRADLFVAVQEFVAALAARAPLLLVIEDAHWADQSTRDLLSFLLARENTGQAALVVTYRTDDLHRRHPLRPQLSQWARTPGVAREIVDPLGRQASRSVVRELAADLPAAAVERLVQRADGNPFFLEELAGAARSGPAALPDDLADVLLMRLDPLTEDARAVVRLASAAGRRVDHALLAATRPDRLEIGLREAVDANVLVPDHDGYRFRHALLGEAVYDDLLPGERVRLHAAYATVLQDRPQLGSAAELARHAAAAQDRRTALLAGIEAGHEAMTVGGPDEAAHHFQQAIMLLADSTLGEDLSVDVSRLAVAAAEALSASGHAPRAADLLTDQLARLPREAPPEWRSRMLATRAMALSASDSEEEIADITSEAVSLLPPGPSGLRAHVLASHARVLTQARRHDEARVVCEEALALAQTLDRPAIAVDVRITRTQITGAGTLDERRAELRQCLSQAQALGSVFHALRARFHLALTYEAEAEFDEAITLFSEGLALAERAGTPWAPYAMDCWMNLTRCRLATGDWDLALELASADVARPEIPEALATVLRAHVEVARGGEPDVSGTRPLWPQEGLLAIFSTPVAIEIAGRRGDADAVDAAYDDCVAVAGALWRPWFPAQVRLGAVGVRAFGEILPVVATTDRPSLVARAERLVDWGRECVVRWQARQGTWGPEGRSWQARLDAEFERLRWLAGIDPPDGEGLVTAWREALAATVAYGARYEIAVVRADLAEALRATGDASGARDEASLARTVAKRLGARPLLDRLDAVAPVDDHAEPGQPALTPREREILTLLADGLTNGEIGKRLFISTKTVSVHVSRILAKMGATSRTEAAALARRTGLVT